MTRLPEMMHPPEMIESSAWPQRRPSVGEDELRRRRLRLIRAQRPLRIVEVELRD